MQIRDLGTIDAPLLFFGGPYSNRQATAALIAEAARLGVPARQMICTGDTVAYCAAPAETVALLRDLDCAVVAGNCERQLAAGAMDCGCGFETGTTCDLLSAGWYAHADRQVGAADRAWMESLPDVMTFTHQGLRGAVIHGGVSDISRFLWPTSEDAAFAEELALLREAVGELDLVVAGHCGLAFERVVNGTRWLNAGVIGMPPNDGGQATSFALLKDGQAEILSLTYDAEAAAEEMRRAGLTQGYDRALLTGYWPSEDVLPPDLRRVLA